MSHEEIGWECLLTYKGGEWLMGDVVSRKPPVVRFSPKAWQPAIYVYETNREVVSLVDEALKSALKD